MAGRIEPNGDFSCPVALGSKRGTETGLLRRTKMLALISFYFPQPRITLKISKKGTGCDFIINLFYFTQRCYLFKGVLCSSRFPLDVSVSSHALGVSYAFRTKNRSNWCS